MSYSYKSNGNVSKSVISHHDRVTTSSETGAILNTVNNILNPAGASKEPSAGSNNHTIIPNHVLASNKIGLKRGPDDIALQSTKLLKFAKKTVTTGNKASHASASTRELPRVGCPFHKNDPTLTTNTSCYGKGWPDIGKLKYVLLSMSMLSLVRSLC